jgi:hypothetical protein
MHMRALPIPDAGLLLEHSEVFSGPMERRASVALASHYVNDGGFIVQCSNCRRVRRSGEAIWDWIPGWLASPPASVSHGVCEVCVAYYYGARMRRDGGR